MNKFATTIGTGNRRRDRLDGAFSIGERRILLLIFTGAGTWNDQREEHHDGRSQCESIHHENHLRCSIGCVDSQNTLPTSCQAVLSSIVFREVAMPQTSDKLLVAVG